MHDITQLISGADTKAKAPVFFFKWYTITRLKNKGVHSDDSLTIRKVRVSGIVEIEVKKKNCKRLSLEKE